MFCKHKWVVLDKTTTKCLAAVAKGLGRTITGSLDLYEEKHRLVLGCTVCGKLNKSVLSNL